MSPRTCAQALAAAQSRGLERLEAQWLLLHALGRPADARAWLLAHDTDALDDVVARRFESLVERRAAGEPLAYVVGSTEFFGLTLQVDPRVLIPRPDTETLVNWSLEVLSSLAEPRMLEILDLGTGSGAIALALAHSLKALNRPAHVTAVDASADALAVAGENARRLGLNIRFIESDWFEQVSEPLHLIASNPPYIASADAHLTDLTHEPLEALTAGPDGLDDLRHIIDQGAGHLVPGGWLLLEHGYDQARQVRKLLDQRGFVQVQSRLDLAGLERCSGGRWPG